MFQRSISDAEKGWQRDDFLAFAPCPVDIASRGTSHDERSSEQDDLAAGVPSAQK